MNQSLEQAEQEPFSKPWHAQLFATTHALARAGAFTWPEWTEHFSAAIAKAEAAGATTDGSPYYDIWLHAFETFLVRRELADEGDIEKLKSAWTRAYLSTPHGQPIHLNR